MDSLLTHYIAFILQIIMTKYFTSPVDRFSINGAWTSGKADLLDPDVDVNGDWHWDNTTNEFSYLGNLCDSLVDLSSYFLSG